jgi:DNA-binding response OmpR family regulator
MTMSKYVLVVDDDPDLVESLALNLSSHGFEVGKAYDGEEGLESIKQRKPDAVVLDVMMPRKDGYAVCAELKADPKTKDIPVVMLTAVGSAVTTTSYTHRDGMTMEADEYVAKPVDLNALAKLVADLL